MSALTLNQLETIYDQVDILIDNLDPAAIDELFGGDEKDIEKVPHYFIRGRNVNNESAMIPLQELISFEQKAEFFS